MQRPARMPLYASMAALGSLLGCVLLFLLARKIEEAAFHRRVGARGEAIRHWVVRNGFGGMLVAAMLPPPTPFKFFVLAAGGFLMPPVGFSSPVGVGRGRSDFWGGDLGGRRGGEAFPRFNRRK